MTEPNRLDPLTFAGCLSELASDVPPGLTLRAWRSQRTSHGSAGGTGLAPQDRAQGARWGRRRPPRQGGPSERRT